VFNANLRGNLQIAPMLRNMPTLGPGRQVKSRADRWCNVIENVAVHLKPTLYSNKPTPSITFETRIIFGL
jgi:hypothetical protein